MNLALTIPLAGRQLIEAAAGTGKTHTIKTLFARLVVEKGIPVDRILAVTYTEAAAKELKDRIRAALEELSLPSPADPTAAELQKRRNDNPALFDRRLHCALRDFDEAMIGTIHGFAARMLAEFAFESGRPFEQELAADNRAAIRECVLDYCRRYFYPATRRELEILEAAGVTVPRLQTAIAAIFSVPGAEIAESAPPPDPERLRAAAEKLLPRWRAEGPATLSAIAESRLLSHSQTAYHPNRIAAIRSALDAFADTGVFDGATAAAIRAISTSELAAALTEGSRKKNLSYSPHPLFEYAEEFVRELAKFRLGILLEVRDFVAGRMRQLRERDNFGSFNDLLTDLAALAAGDAEAAKLLRNRFDAALIDEFQDTDPVQFEIFSSLFADPAQPLLLVGDPKQAIYSFRGADIFTYDRARRETANRLALDTNFRSEARLVEAVNQVFSRPGQPVFGCDFVSYGEAIKPGGRPESEDRVLRYRGETDLQPLKILFLSDSGSPGGNRTDRSGRRANRGQARRTAADRSRLHPRRPQDPPVRHRDAGQRQFRGAAAQARAGRRQHPGDSAQKRLGLRRTGSARFPDLGQSDDRLRFAAKRPRRDGAGLLWLRLRPPHRRQRGGRRQGAFPRSQLALARERLHHRLCGAGGPGCVPRETGEPR